MIGHHRRHRAIITAGLALLASRRASADVSPASHQSFADELTSALYTSANECTSALGISMAFSLVYPGCTNDGITEIRDTMGYPDDDDGDEDDTNMQLVWAGTTQRMLSDSAGQSDAPLLKIANSVWVDDNSTLNEDYQEIVGNYANQIDFEAADSPVLVNKWVSNSTNGLINSIVPEDKPLFPPYVLIAINSIYLKARWQKQFKERNTNLDSFYASSSRNLDEASDAHFMNTVGYYSYSHDALPGYQVIDLPFAASDMSMIFVLPMADEDDAKAVTSTNLIGALDDMESTRIALSLPKFKFESTYSDNLKAALISAGITAPFTEGSKALCGIFEDSDICDQLIIDKVVQKTIIEVNEDGVEAAAVTMVGFAPTSIGPQDTNEVILMMLDHPFQFFIYDESEDLVLFEGRLGAPEIPEDKPTTALMDAKHSDVDFWSTKFGVEPVDPTGSMVDSLPTEQSLDSTTSSNMVAQPSKAPIVATTIDTTEHQKFADELTSVLYTSENECSSALGVSMAFSLVYPGCTSNGITEIRDVMRYPDGSNMQLVWEGTTQRMLSASAGQCLDSWSDGVRCNSDAPLLKIANSVWFDDGSTLSTSYEGVVGSYAKQIDFEAADSPVIVNEWVSNSTNGLINSIVSTDKPLFPPYVLIAINSIYLKARWETQFKEYYTNLDSFYASSSRNADEASDAHFMNTVGYFSYSHDALPGYQVIDLPFAASDMSMIFVLPMADDDVHENTKAVSSTDLIGALDDLEFTRIALSLPKFKFESTYADNVKAALISAGIIAPFTEGSRALCGIFADDSTCDQLIIDKVVQKTIIDVNEDGVEAAAVTMVGVSLTSMGPQDTTDPILVLLDHPFQFFIYDKSEDLVLFEGRLGAPEIPEAEPLEPLMDAKHSDPGFWSTKFGVNPMSILLTSTQTSSTVASLPTKLSSDPTSPLNADAQPSKAPILATSVDTTEHQKFADELTTILYTNDNECSSALGVSMAFSLVYPGCTDDGITEIKDVMRYPDGSNMQLVWEGTTQRMLSASDGQCIGSDWDDECIGNAPLLQIANSVWLDDNSTLNQDYELVVGSFAKQIDFEADDSPIIVNEWVSNSTNGLIDSIVPEDKPLFPPLVLLAINSIYLKARWAEQFEERNTNLDTFYASASRNTQVSEAHFMNMVEYFPYSHEAMPGYQVIDLPFAESKMSMIFVLPMSDDAGAVQSSDLLPALGGLQSTRIAVSVPKFKFESEYKDNLKSALIQLGIEAPFTEGSGALCGVFEDIGNCKMLRISEVIQKTVIDVNEKGVEAAAVTMIGIVGESAPATDLNAPVLMMLDHPFQFFIYDKTEDLVLFEGRVGAPEVPEAEPAVPLLDMVHSDTEFWSSAFNAPDPVAPSVDKTTTGITNSSMTSQAATTQPPTASDSPTTKPLTASPTSSDAPTIESADIRQPTVAPTTKPLIASPTSSPTKPVPSSSTNAPNIASEPPTSAPNKSSESADTSQPTVSSGTKPLTTSFTSSPTKPVSSSPTKAPNIASESPTSSTNEAASDSSTNKRGFSLLAFMCLALALMFVF